MWMQRQKNLILALGVSALLPLALNGCFGKDEKDCVPVDQRASLMPALHAFPIQVVMDQSFTSSEQTQITGAVAEWNATTQALLGHPFFTLVTHDVPAGIRDANPNDCNQALGNEGTFFLLRESQDSHWESIGFTKQIPGATVRCQRGDTVEHQIIMVNVNLIDQRQLQSVVLHELGHSIGLDHSCQGGGDKADYKGCGGFPAGHPYHDAVMYPWLSADVKANGEPETKTTLQDNDKQRAACLYSNP